MCCADGGSEARVTEQSLRHLAGCQAGWQAGAHAAPGSHRRYRNVPPAELEQYEFVEGFKLLLSNNPQEVRAGAAVLGDAVQ
jgi:hypothetical protein